VFCICFLMLSLLQALFWRLCEHLLKLRWLAERP
jgi:hypothetical protein